MGSLRRKIIIIENSDKLKFEEEIKEKMNHGWLPHWETFKIKSPYYYIILETWEDN